jgi:hypothetical protein
MKIKDKGNLRFQEKLLDVILFGGKFQGMTNIIISTHCY